MTEETRTLRAWIGVHQNREKNAVILMLTGFVQMLESMSPDLAARPLQESEFLKLLTSTRGFNDALDEIFQLSTFKPEVHRDQLS